MTLIYIGTICLMASLIILLFGISKVEKELFMKPVTFHAEESKINIGEPKLTGANGAPRLYIDPKAGYMGTPPEERKTMIVEELKGTS